MAYAELASVKSAAGVIAPAWGEDTTPADQDIETFLAEVAAEIDAVLASFGFTSPTENERAIGALTSLNRDGALILALEATYPQESSGGAASDLLKAVRDRYSSTWQKLLDGKHAAVLVLRESEQGEDAVASASNFWDDDREPDAFLEPDPILGPRVAPANDPARLPAVRRGQSY